MLRGPQQDLALPHAPTMSPPNSPPEDHEPGPSHSPAEQGAEEFQFLRCQACKAEAKCPKLLSCLHTLCSRCLEERGMQCPICCVLETPGSGAAVPALNNTFFESLQGRLSVYRQIVDAQALCTRCKEAADFWCFECEHLLCAKCFEAHQWFLKHEAQRLAELRSQSVCEFLDGTRKSNNIYCSNPNHRTPALTSIYCRGCSKPLCCSCALLDSGHGDLMSDISTEIQQRQSELDGMTHALREQDGAFGAAHAQVHAAIDQLDQARRDTEELIRQGVRQLLAHVQAQERELLQAVEARYHRDRRELDSRMGRLDTVLQRIRTGSTLVERMKRYASDQEVLDMHSFLRQALCSLRQEEPQSLQAPVCTDGFKEFKARLQSLSSCVMEGKDAAPSRRASPEAASTPRDPIDIDPPEKVQRVQAQGQGPAEAQSVAVVQPVPGAHPVPVFAFSIKEPSCGEISHTTTSQKRKSCQTQSPRKVIKMESEEEREARLARSPSVQPRPSTSKAVSPFRLDGPTSPGHPTVGDEVSLPSSNHLASTAGEEAEERIVVISSSEDSDVDNPCVEPMETTEPHSPPAHTLLRGPGASPPRQASCLPNGTCHPPAWPPHHPAERAATSCAQPANQPAERQEHTAGLRRINFRWHRGRITRLRQALHLPLQLYRSPMWASPTGFQASTLATTGSPSHPSSAQEHPTCLQTATRSPRRMGRALRSRSRLFQSSSHLAQWLNNFFALPLSSVASQLGASPVEGPGGGRASQTLGAGEPPRDSDRVPMDNPQG